MEQEIKKEMEKSTETKPTAAAKGKNTTMAMIAYIVFFIPLLAEDKNDAFVKFHVKQGMVLFVGFIASGFIGMVPLIGILGWLLSLVMLALMVIGIMGAYKGEQKPLPLIGKYADSFKI